MAQLLVLQGACVKNIYQLQSHVTLGCTKRCDIVVDPQTPAGENTYCEIRQLGNRYKIFNNDNHPIFVNGALIQDSNLSHGDIVTINNCIFLFSEVPDIVPAGASVEQTLESIIATLKPEDREEKELLLLYKISNLIFYSLNLQELLKQLGNTLLEYFSAETIILLLKLHNSNFLRPMLVQGVRNKLTASEITDCSEVFKLNLIFHKKQAVTWKQEQRHMMGTPLIKQNQVFGVLVLEKAQQWTEKELLLFSNVGLLLASGITNIENYNQKKEQLRRLEILNNITRKLSSLLNHREIFKEAARETCNLLKCTKSSVLILDKKNCLKVAYAVGIGKEDSRKIRVSVGEGIAGWVAEHGYPVTSNGMPKELSPTSRKRYLSDSFVVVPIFAPKGNKQKIVGVLCATDRIDQNPLSDVDKELITFMANQIGIALANAELFEKATVDHVTKLYLRGHSFEKLQECLDESKRYCEPLTLMLLDLDYFKKVNDNYGHQIGDVILHELGIIIKSMIREEDIAGRYGGEEFIVAIRNANYDRGMLIANRIRKAVENFVFNQDGQPISLTISIGVAEYMIGESLEDLILRADRAMYRAKENGRNRVC